MKFGTASLVTVIFMFLTSFLTIYNGYWYLIALFAGLIGVIAGPSKIVGVEGAVGSILAFIAYIALVNGTESFAQASLLSGIIGIPGGSSPVLIITLLLIFAFSLLGYLVGSSFHVLSSKEHHETS